MNPVDYESKVIKLLLNHGNLLPAIRSTTEPKFFLSPQHRTLYQAILDYSDFSNGVVPTADILKAWLTKNNPDNAELLCGLLERVLSSPSEPGEEQHIAFYTRQLLEAWQAHGMQNQMLGAVEKLKQKDIEGARLLLQKESFTARDHMVEGNLVTDLTSVMTDIEFRAKNWERFRAIDMGFPSLDKATHGHGKKELVVIIGGTGVGKSLVLGQVAINVAKQAKRVLLVTVENDKRSYMNRLYANISQVPYWKFKTSQLDSVDKHKWLTHMGFLPENFDLQLVEFPEGCSARDIWYYMKSQSKKFDYLVVDQITNMEPNDKESLQPMSWTWFGQIALDLKRLASYAYDNEGIPVFSAAQAAGGTVGKKTLTTDDIAMAKIIAHHAHGVVYITREEEEYNMGASKWRDARVDVYPVFPEFAFWAVSENPRGIGGSVVDLSGPSPDNDQYGEELTPEAGEKLVEETATTLDLNEMNLGETVPEEDPKPSGGNEDGF